MSANLALYNQLEEFALGRHLLAKRSLDGYWTKYCVVEHPKNRHNPQLHVLEQFLLNEAPAFLATQERFSIAQAQLKTMLRDGMSIASVPCGFMDDVLGIEYDAYKAIQLTGCDNDPVSCEGALRNAAQRGLSDKVQVHCMDAWDLARSFPCAFDILTSNGLNIYVKDIQKERDLYTAFAGALKPGGYLILSFLTPPPTRHPASPWQNVDAEALQKQKVIFSDVLGVAWQNYHLPEEMIVLMRHAGLEVQGMFFDRQRIFPTLIAQKI